MDPTDLKIKIRDLEMSGTGACNSPLLYCIHAISVTPGGNMENKAQQHSGGSHCLRDSSSARVTTISMTISSLRNPVLENAKY
jgi:hypothetical protein